MTYKLLQVKYRFCLSICALLMATVQELKGYILPNQPIVSPGDRQARLSIADWSTYNYREPEGPGTYAFGYDVDDADSGNTQFRQEERHPNGTVTGSYGYVDPFGIPQVVRYIADERGYRATIQSGQRRLETRNRRRQWQAAPAFIYRPTVTANNKYYPPSSTYSNMAYQKPHYFRNYY